MLGGGGSVAVLYQTGVRGGFALWHLEPEIIPLPLPEDLEWPPEIDDHDSLFRRISVAYGLSFDRDSLDKHRYPTEIQDLPREDGERQLRPSAPSKDEV